MNTRFIKINNCKHYFLNEHGLGIMYFIHSDFFVEIDYSITHPFGKVYKPKGCLDTPIRFVKQPNNSTLMFKSNDWNNETNKFSKRESFFQKFKRKFLAD